MASLEQFDRINMCGSLNPFSGLFLCKEPFIKIEEHVGPMNKPLFSEEHLHYVGSQNQ